MMQPFKILVIILLVGLAIGILLLAGVSIFWNTLCWIFGKKPAGKKRNYREPYHAELQGDQISIKKKIPRNGKPLVCKNEKCGIKENRLDARFCARCGELLLPEFDKYH